MICILLSTFLVNILNTRNCTVSVTYYFGQAGNLRWFIVQLTVFMEQSPSCEAHSSSVKFPHFKAPKFNYRVDSNPTLHPILNLINPRHSFVFLLQTDAKHQPVVLGIFFMQETRKPTVSRSLGLI